MGRRILAIVVAAVLALIGGVMVLLYARNADARAVAAASPRTVFVSSLGIPAGTSIRDAIRLKILQTQFSAKEIVRAAPSAAVAEAAAEAAAVPTCSGAVDPRHDQGRLLGTDQLTTMMTRIDFFSSCIRARLAHVRLVR